MAKNRMTFEKQMRETKKRQKAAEKRADRRRRKDGDKVKPPPLGITHLDMPDPIAPDSAL